MLQIVDFSSQYFPEAASLALSVYAEARQQVPVLPLFERVLEEFACTDNGMGVAAIEDGHLIGFLCSYPPVELAFRSTHAKGVFSPIGGNAAKKENRGKIYAAMYQAAGAKWVNAGATSHAISLFAHDEELQRQFYLYGFGLRCMDAIRKMERIDCTACHGYTFTELSSHAFPLVYPLAVQLSRHCHKSPFFMNRPEVPLAKFLQHCSANDTRLFVAFHDGLVCAYISITKEGETWIATDPGYKHIDGAYCLPAHRGQGVFQNLLNFAISILKREGFTLLGVDFESLNPTAYHFWLKYFDAYTHSVVRRIDERIFEVGD